EEKPEEIIETVETPTQKIVRRKKKPAKKDQPAVITQEVIQKTDEERKVMEEEQIVEITETPQKKVIKKKKSRITEAGLPEEVMEEIVIEKPKKKKAKPAVEEEGVVTVTEVTVYKPDEEKPREEEKPDEIIETIETPTQKIVRRKKKPAKKDQPAVITQEVIQKTDDERKVMEEEQIVEITETPQKKVIKKKKSRITEAGVPEDVVEEIVIEKPKKEKATPTVDEEDVVTVTEAVKEKPAPKKKKKKAPKKDEIEEWVEPEYERPVLEPMPEKVQWEPTKKKKEKKSVPPELQKLIPQKIERKEIKPTKLKYTGPEDVVQFGSIKLKKVTVPKKKETKDSKIPKVLLRSRITFIGDYPPELQKPKMTVLEENPIQVGILSRNTEEALKVLKKKHKKPKLPEKELIDLDKLDKEFEALKEIPLEEIEDKSVYERKPKKKKEEPGKPQKLVVQKGKIPAQEEPQPEEVKLKKVPTKEIEEIEESPKKPVKEDTETVFPKEKKRKPKTKLEHEEFKPSDFDRPELEKYVPEETEKPEEPKPEPTPKPYVKEKRKKPDQDIEQVPLIPGKPKSPEPEEEPEIKFRIPQKEKPEEEPETITLKGWKKEKPTDEGTEEFPDKKDESMPKLPKDETEDVTMKRKTKPKKPKKKDASKESVDEIPLTEVESLRDLEEKTDVLEDKVPSDESYPKPVTKESILDEIDKSKEPEKEEVDVPEKVKEKPLVKKKKKKVPKKDEIEEWVEPEYERPVLEPMPEKIQWEPTKKKKEKKPLPPELQKLVPQKIERKEIKPTKLKYTEPEDAVQFGTIKLKKVTVPKKKEVDVAKMPKVLLRSRITFIGDYPPELQKPKMTVLEENPIQVGILSRNTEEALKILKKKYKKPKLPEKEITELEKLDKEFEKLKEIPLEEVEDKSVYERKPKKKKEVPEKPQKLVVQKGKVPPQEEPQPEEVKLKKVPTKEIEEIEESPKKPVKEDTETVVPKEKKRKPKTKLEHEEFKPSDFDRPELEKYVPEETEKPEEPKPEPTPKPYVKEKRKKPDQDIEQVPLIPGKPKSPEPEEEPEIKFRIPQKEKPEEEPETITLKGWKKEKPTDEGTEEFPDKKNESMPKLPKDETEEVTMKRRAKPKKPKKKDISDESVDEIPIMEKESLPVVEDKVDKPSEIEQVEDTTVEDVVEKKVVRKQKKKPDDLIDKQEKVNDIPLALTDDIEDTTRETHDRPKHTRPLKAKTDEIVTGDTLEKTTEEELQEEIIEETPTTKIIKKKKPRAGTEEIIEEMVEDLVTEKPKKEKAQPVTEVTESIKITQVEVEEAPQTKEETVVVEEEIIETPTRKVIRMKVKPQVTEQKEEIIEKIIEKPSEEVSIMEEKGIIEIIETPTKKTIKKKTTVIKDDGVPEEVIEEIVIEKPKKEKAKPTVQEKETVTITEVTVQKVDDKKPQDEMIIEEITKIEDVDKTTKKKVQKKLKPKKKDEVPVEEGPEQIIPETVKVEVEKPEEEKEEEIIEVIETPTKKIIKKEKKPTKKDQPTVITQEIIEKTAEETKVMEEQQIVEITETPSKKIIKKKKSAITESGVPEEKIEEIVIEKPITEKAIEEIVSKEGIQITEIITESYVKELPRKEAVIPEEIKPTKLEKEEVKITDITVKKAPSKKKKADTTKEQVVEEYVEEIVTEKPEKKKISPTIATEDSIQVTEVISEDTTQKIPEFKIQKDVAKPGEKTEEKITVDQVLVMKAPKETEEGIQISDVIVESITEEIPKVKSETIEEELRPKEGIEVTEIITEVTSEELPKEQTQTDKARPIQEEEEKVTVTKTRVTKFPKKQKEEQQKDTVEELQLEKPIQEKAKPAIISQEALQTTETITDMTVGKIPKEDVPKKEKGLLVEEKPEEQPEITEVITQKVLKKKPTEEHIEISEVVTEFDEKKPQEVEAVPVVEELPEVKVTKKPKIKRLSKPDITPAQEERPMPVDKEDTIIQPDKSKEPEKEEVDLPEKVKEKPLKPTDEGTEEFPSKEEEEEEVSKPLEEETEEITIQRKTKPKKPKKKPITDEEPEKVLLEKPKLEKEEQVPTEVAEEITLPKKPEIKSTTEEIADEVTIKKPDVKEETPEVTLKKKPKKEPVPAEVKEEVTLKKPEPEKEEKAPEQVTEEVAIKKKPKKKPVKEEAADEVTIKKPVPKKKPVKEEAADEVIIKKPVVVEEEKQEVVEEVTLKKKPKKEPVPEEVTEEVTLKKPEPKDEEKAPEEVTEEVAIKKKPEKKPVKEEAADEVIIKKPVVVEEEKEEVVEEVTLKKKPKKEPVPEEVKEEVTLKKPEPEKKEKAPEEVTEEVAIKKKPKKKPVKEEAADEVIIKKPVVVEEEKEEVVEEVTLKKKPKKKPVPEEVTEEVTLKKPEPKEEEKAPEEITEEVAIKKKPKKKPVKEEAADEITIKKPVVVEEEKEEVVEEVTLKKKPKKEPVPEEVKEEVTLKKPEPEKKEKAPEEVTEEVAIKKKPKKKPVKEEAADEVIIKKPVVVEEEKEEVVEEVTLKKKPKKKPVPEEVTEEVTLKKPEPKEEEKAPEEITEEVAIKKKPKKKPVKEEAADEITIKKPVVVEEEKEEVVEEVTLKKKPKKEPVPEEVTEEVTLKKPGPKKEEKTPEEVTEEVAIKRKPKKKPVKEEAADEITIKKPVVVEEEKEEVVEEVILKKKPKKEAVPEEVTEEVTLKKPGPEKEEKAPEEVTEEVAIKRKPKKKPVKEEAADEITIKKPVVVEKEKEDEPIEEITLKRKPKKKPSVTEEVEETEVIIKEAKKPEVFDKGRDEVHTDITLKKEKKVKPKVEEVVADELTIQRIEEIEQPEEEEIIEEFTVKRKPPKQAPKPIEELYEDVTLRKLRPKRKPRADIKEVTEAENVTFRPRSTKTKEDVEQEFKISLNTYEEEDISMSGKVRLKPKKRPMTYSEETGEETIRLIQEVEDDSGPIIEEIIDESDEEGKYSIEELETDELRLPLRRKVKKQPRPYSVEEFEEDVQMKLKRDRKYSYEETDETLALKLKAKRRPSTYEEEEATLSITREEDISEEDEVEYVVRDGDTMYSICSYEAETDEAINLVEGEKVYIIDHTNQDWWFVKKNLTAEKGWVPAQYLLDEVHYTIYLQRKLHEKIDKLPVFEKPAPGEKASAPRFIEKLQPIHTPDGYTVQFECQVEGVPRPQITWFRQTAIIKPSTDFQMYYDDDNVATLIIREVFPEDAGTFTCVAKNAAGFASSTTELIVEAPLSDHGSDLTGPSRKSLSRESSLADILEGIPPTFSRKPKAKYVNEGDDVILESRLVAVPEPEITCVVKISKVKKQQEGRYKIVAKNREGEATIEIPLKVKTSNHEPPEILEPLQSYVVREGETVMLSTQIVGNPAPKVVWYKDGKPLKNLTPQQDGHVNTLTIIQPQLEDTGEYSVVATNNLGKAETQATLVVEKIPSGAPQPPLFTERFQELTVPEKGTFKLIAKVTGNPVPEITWLRNNKPLEKSPNITRSYDGENIVLEIRNADSETDAGDYKCVASNPVGKASHGAKVTVDVDKVTFTKNLQKEVTVDEYKMLELICETSHTVSTTWWHNNKEISGMDHRVIIQEGRLHKLVIKKTNLIDEGTYKCTVKNQTTSSTVTVKPAKPEFVKKLQDFEVKEREIAILEVEITSETANVEWYKDGVPLKPSNEKLDFVKEGTIRKLLIRSTSVHDEGEYTCTLPDEHCTAEVTVVELPPEIITKMQDVTIARGEKAIFDIELTKGDALVRWFKDGQELQFSEHVQLSIDGKRQKLKIYDSEPEDAGVYSCQAGEQTSSAKLTVEEPGVDFIAKLPDVTLVPLNADATFLIELSQSNVPVTWLRKGEIIKQSEKYIVIDEGTIKKLIVKKCTTEDIAEYTAVVTNVKTSSKLKVEVTETPPKINPDTNTKYTANKGDDIEIIVKFTATPKPTDEWTVDGRIVTKSKRIIPSLDEESATLTIRKVQEEDIGDYNLRLFNPHGEAAIVINVTIAQPPGKPGTPEPLEFTNDSVTLHWKKPESDGNLPITEYILEYHEKTETSWTKVSEKIIETSHKVTKLTTNKEYTFRVTAVNEVGPGEPSSETQYLKISKPSEIEPPIILEPLKSINIGLKQTVTLTCVIGGSPTPEITWLKNGQPFADTNMIYENRVAKYTIQETTETSSATFTVKAVNEAGTAETTCQLTIQEPPKLTVDESLASQKLTVNSQWKVDVQTSGFPKPDVTWSKNSQTITDKRVSIHTTEKISIVSIDSIIREDTGTYTAEATNDAGRSSIDIQLKVIDKPGKPQGPIITKEIRRDRITVEWKPPIDDGGLEIEKYTIEKCETDKMNWIKVADVDKDMESFCVQKLQLEVEYMFRVIAKNAVGASEPLESEPVKTRMSYDPPGPPRGPLEVSGMTKTSFTIKWQVPENDGGSPITDYTIEITETSKKAWQKVGNTKSDVLHISVSNLKTDMSYDFRITAKNKIGMGEPYISEEPIVAGKRATPPSSPLNVRVTNVTSKSVTLTWSPPASNGGTELTGYIIEKRPLIGKGARWIKVVTLDATTHQHCIENLKESEFLFRIFAENCMGLSTPTNSEPVTLKTHAIVPSAPTAPLEIRQIAANTVVIEWGRPESDGGAPLEGYRIVMRDAKKTMWIEVGRVKADIQKINIKDLQENHEYLVRIYARNEVGLSEPLESDEPFKIVPISELSVVEPIAEATDKGETASLSTDDDNANYWGNLILRTLHKILFRSSIKWTKTFEKKFNQKNFFNNLFNLFTKNCQLGRDFSSIELAEQEQNVNKSITVDDEKKEEKDLTAS
ncbi:hypothetical protein KPH14_005570, partial [Odynerus spinipes]